MIGTEIRRITGVRLAGGRACDLQLADGVITSLRLSDRDTDADTETGPDHLHLPDWMILPSAVEPHAHVDKAFSWSQTNPRYGDLNTAIDCWRTYATQMPASDVYSRARRAFSTYLAHGITAVRSHVDLLSDPDPLRGLAELVRLREELRNVMTIQVALLCSSRSPLAQLTAAMKLGVDVVGGCPHLAPDPAAETSRLLDLAERFGRPVDLHTDEQLGAEVQTIRPYIGEVARRGLGGRAVASHCVSLGSMPMSELTPLIAEIHQAGLGIVSLPITNLYLQGRADPVLRPRGITALRALLDAGVPVAAGGDNVRDPFNPMGRADPFETTSLLITAGHLRAEEALAAVTTNGRRLLGLSPAGPAIGQRADLMLVRAETLTDALAGPGDDRIVLYGGRIVSRTTVHVEQAHDLIPTP